MREKHKPPSHISLPDVAQAAMAHIAMLENELLVAQADVERLHGIVQRLADRVAVQSELLSKKAEKP